MGDQNRLYQKIQKSQISQQRAVTSVQALLRKELTQAQERLRIEQDITKELQKRGAYINDDGRIAFDQSRGDRFRRKGGEILRSPASSLAVGIVGGFATEAIKKNFDSASIYAELVQKRIKELEETLQGLSGEKEIKDANDQLKALQTQFEELTKSSQEFQTGIDQAATILTGLAYAATVNTKLGVGLGGFALGYALGDKFVKPEIEKATARPIDLAGGIDLADLKGGTKAYLKALESLATSTAFLSQEVKIGAYETSQSLKALSEAALNFDENIFGGNRSDINLSKKINDLLGQSKIEGVKDIANARAVNLDKASVDQDLLGFANQLTNAVNTTIDTKALDAGLDPNKVSSANLQTQFGDILAKTVDNLKTGVNSKLLGGVLNAAKSDTEGGTKKLAEELVKLGKRFPNNLAAVQGATVGENVLKASSGNDITKEREAASFAIRSLVSGVQTAGSSGSFDNFEGLVEVLEGFGQKGLIDGDQLQEFSKSYLQILQKYGQEEEKRIAEKFQNELQILERQSQINNEFIDKLKKTYEDSVSGVRDARGVDVGESISSSNLRDVFSKEFSEALSSLGIEGFNKSGAIGAENLRQFANSIFSQTSSRTDKEGNVVGGLSQTLGTLAASKTPVFFSKENQQLLKDELGQRDISDNVDRLQPRTRRLVGTPLLQAQEALQKGQFGQAISLQKQATGNLAGLNLPKGGAEEEELKRIILTIGQQTKLADDFLKSKFGGQIEAAGSQVDANIGEKAQTLADEYSPNLEGIQQGLDEVGTLLKTKFGEEIKNVAEALPSVVTATSQFADQLEDFGKSLRFEAFMQGAESLGKTLTELANDAGRVGDALDGVEAQITKAGQAAGSSLSQAGADISTQLSSRFAEIDAAMAKLAQQLSAGNIGGPFN